mgnify:CR=1 FL=1
MGDRVLILKSETGSGKSTLLPPKIYIEFIMRHPATHLAKSAGLICTQPRVLTAVENVMKIIPWNKELRLGENIGWSTQYNKFRPRSFGLLSATIGTLTQQLKVMTDEEVMDKYAFILIDETHERDLQTDMTIYMLKNFLHRNSHKQACPFVVIMSATFDPKSFLEYFGVPEATNYIWCRGEAAGFTDSWGWYEPKIITNYCTTAVDCVEKIVRENPNEGPSRADILIFMPGIAEITETWKGIHGLNKKLVAGGISPVYPLRLDSRSVAISTHEYLVAIVLPLVGQTLKIDGAEYQPTRRVIISTNVAETGLTIDDLKYVIDAGYNKEMEYNPILGLSGLISKPAPRSRIIQRRGRSGRLFPGVFYPMYSLETFKSLPENQLPQILLGDVSAIYLDIMQEQLRAKTLAGETDPIFRIEDIDMVDKPSSDALHEALELHHALGFVDFRGHNITPLGELATKFTMQHPRITRMLLAAFCWRASPLDIASIAAYLSVATGRGLLIEQPKDEVLQITVEWPEIYAVGFGIFKHAYESFRAYAADDFLHGVVLFEALGKVAAKRDLKEWCNSVNISYVSVLNFVGLREVFIQQALTAEINMFAFANNRLVNASAEELGTIIARLKHCIYDGFRQNLLVRQAGKYYTSSGLPVTIPRIIPKEIDTKKFAAGPFGAIAKMSPKYVIYDALSLKQHRKEHTYSVVCSNISVMDGFVSCDLSFLI